MYDQIQQVEQLPTLTATGQHQKNVLPTLHIITGTVGLLPTKYTRTHWCTSTGTQRCEHTTSTTVLHKLYWLPIRQRVEFKLACLVHQSLAGQTPTYLTYDIWLTADTGRPQL